MAQPAALNQRECRLLKMIGANIVYYRKQLGLTQEKMAERADISRVHLARVETGVGAASLPLLFTISETLDVPLKALFDFPEEE